MQFNNGCGLVTLFLPLVTVITIPVPRCVFVAHIRIYLSLCHILLQSGLQKKLLGTIAVFCNSEFRLYFHYIIYQPGQSLFV